MRSERLDAAWLTEPLADSSFFKAAAVSLLLHAGLLTVVLRSSFVPDIEVLPQVQRQYLGVTLVQRLPARAEPPAVEEPQARVEVTSPAVQNPEPVVSEMVPEVVPEIVPEVVREVVREIAPEIPQTAEPGASADALAPDAAQSVSLVADAPADGVTQPAGPALNPTTIRAAVNSYVASRRGALIEDWVTACLIYQKEHGTRACPQQQPEDYSGQQLAKDAARGAFASVTRPREHARLTAALLNENARLAPLMKEEGVLGQLAAERYYLNREYVFYLNGNYNFGVAAFVQASMSSNGNLAYLGNYMQFICDPMPCVYDFTGFTVVRPRQEVVEDEFRVTTTLFGSRK